MGRINVAILTNIPTPYREGLFRRLAAVDQLDVTIYYCATTFPWREWDVQIGNYNHEILPGFGSGSRLFNPSIVTKIFKENFDVVIVSGYAYPTALLAIAASKITKKPLTLWVESHLRDERNVNASQLKRDIKKIILSRLVRLSDAFIVPGRASKQYLEYFGADSGRIFPAVTTSDVEFFSQNSNLSSSEMVNLKRKLGIKEDKLLISVGRFAKKKGIKILLEAFLDLRSERQDIGLLLVGSGPLEQELKEFSERNGGHAIYFLGFQPQEMLPKLYAISDLFVCPSLGDQWALVVNEAMACGLPVITTYNVGAAYDLVKPGENGFVIEPGDVKALHIAIKEALESEEKLKQMGSVSRKIISKYTHEQAVSGFLKAIDFVINHHSKRVQR